jgi:hypothetical protein
MIFTNFWQKMVFFSKTNVMIKFLQKLAACSLGKKKNWRKYFKNRNIGPRRKTYVPVSIA